jgi:tripartite-type tricarboxylate transporter receptor subunit TctC
MRSESCPKFRWIGNRVKLPRRQFLRLAAAVAALPAVPRFATAQTYPTRPVRIIGGFPVGSSPDIFARLIGQSLSDRLGQQFVIENRPGAGSNIGTEAVVRSAPDGYTLLLATSANAINATLYNNLSFNFIHDVAPVASIVRVPHVMEVNPSFPAKTVSEFIAYAKANPGKINMASAGSGTPQHVMGELFKVMAGVDMLHVPYRGITPALTDLLGGQVQVIFDAVPSSIEYVKAGKLRPLAATSWFGVGAPRNTASEIVEKLNKEVNAVLADPKTKARLADLGGLPLAGSPADFAALIAEETEKWGKVVKFAGAKPD